MSPRMIFHVPFVLDENAGSASGIRPVQMRNAFRDLGYDVTVVSGHSKERGAAMRAVREAVRRGETFDFCYSESSTMPMSMTDPNHLPLHPLQDYAFFRELRRAGIRVGHFLRDFYWAFPEYRRSNKFPKREVALAGYRWDMLNYPRHVDRLYLPSAGMGAYLNLPASLLDELPPGQGWTEPTPGPTSGVHLFYVGGVGPHYRLHRFVEAVHLARSGGVDVTLTLCTPADQWNAALPEYAEWISDGIRVVQGHGAALRPYFEASNVGALMVEPEEYRSFAAPVKLFDYLGAGKPVLASEGTHAAALAAREGWGWSIPYDTTAIADWLTRAAADPTVLTDKATAVADGRRRHTWRARAQKVASDLSPR